MSFIVPTGVLPHLAHHGRVQFSVGYVPPALLLIGNARLGFRSYFVCSRAHRSLTVWVQIPNMISVPLEMLGHMLSYHPSA